MKKNPHHSYSNIVNKFMVQSSHMLYPSHFFPFSHIYQKEHMPQAKRAATYRLAFYNNEIRSQTFDLKGRLHVR
jgi:hypothetical protein